MKKLTERFTTYLEPEDIERLNALAAQTDRKPSAVLRHLIRVTAQSMGIENRQMAGERRA